MKLYLFDFDGTLTEKDSMRCFVRHTIPVARRLLAVLRFSVYIALFFLKLYPSGKLKEKYLTFLFKNKTKAQLESEAEDFARCFKAYFFSDALAKIKQLQSNNAAELCIVSASLDIWLNPIASQLGIPLICTESAFNNNRFVGFKSKNCYGPEKVNRILQRYNIDDYSEIYAFGDSSGDREMLNFADKGYFKYFKQ